MTNEWTKEIETLRARVAALEAAAIEVWPKWSRHECRLCSRFTTDPSADWHIEGCPMIGGTSALDAVVSAAVAAERARVRAAVEGLDRYTPAEDCGFGPDTDIADDGPFVRRDETLAAIGGAS